MYELLRRSTCSGSSYIRQFTPTPFPQAITYGLRVQQVNHNSCRCTVYAHFRVVTPQHGKASAFGFTVFPFVVQAQALGHRLQSESNRKQ